MGQDTSSPNNEFDLTQMGDGRSSTSQTKYKTRNVYTTFETEEEFADESYFTEELSRGGILSTYRAKTKKFLRKFLNIFLLETWAFMILLGIVCAFSGLLIDYSIIKLYDWQVKFAELPGNFVGGWVLWTFYSLFFASLAIGCVLFISPYAAGSGIPEMKVVLSGMDLPHYLSFRTLVAKAAGLISAAAGGYSIGKEGPLTHISSISCSLLTKIPIFRRIRQNDALVLQYMAAAASVGIQMAVGASIGGVLFSIEVTATYYLVENLWRAFFVVGTTELIFRLIHRLGFLALFVTLNWDVYDFDWAEILTFGVVGLIAGIFGAGFTRLLAYVFQLSQTWTRVSATKQAVYIRCILVALVIAIFAYPFPLLRNDLQGVLEYLLDKQSVTSWGGLFGILVGKLIFTLFSLGFTIIPAGIYAPIFTTGAVFGRLLGEIIVYLIPSLNIQPASVSIIAAAAMSASVTRTISTAVIVIELTQQLKLFFPVLISILVAMSVGKLLSDSVYDILIRQRDLPEMPRFTLYNTSYNKRAMDVMRTELKTLSLNSTFNDVINLLNNSMLTSFPLIDEGGIFLGSIARSSLENLLEDNKFSWIRANPDESLSMAELLDREAKLNASSDYDKIDTGLQVYVNTNTATSHNNNNAIVPVLPQPIAQQQPVQLAANGDVENGVRVSNGSDHSSVISEEPNGSEMVQHIAQLDDVVPFIFTTRKLSSRSHRTSVEVDSTVMQVTSETSLYKVHFLFAMLGLSHLYITSRGKLVGIITRNDLIKSINSFK